MNHLHLSPLPILRPDDVSPFVRVDGFVDEEVVLALVAGNHPARHLPDPEDLALAADDMDFAGWHFPDFPRFQLETQPAPAVEAVRRPAPPEIEEPGIGLPHQGSHRWWLAGLAGALSTMLFAVLLHSLAPNGVSRGEVVSFLQLPAKAPAPPVPVNEADESPVPELTGIEGE